MHMFILCSFVCWFIYHSPHGMHTQEDDPGVLGCAASEDRTSSSNSGAESLKGALQRNILIPYSRAWGFGKDSDELLASVST